MTRTRSQAAPRAVDHLVLPVGSLEAARARLQQLGFTVAPDARHPFGTENCCVFLPDGTYLEPLSVAQREECEAAAREGNVFVARDQAYRFRNGDEGFSAVVFASDDAERDHRSFRAQGFSAGEILRFERVFEDPSGEKATAEFANAFAADLRAPDLFFFACQRVRWPEADRTALATHPNGVRSLREIVMVESNPSDFQYFLQTVINQRDQNAHSFGLDISAANATISALTPEGLFAWFGLQENDSQRGLRCRAIVFGVAQLSKLRDMLDRKAVAYSLIANRVIVPPALGQGAIFAFEEMS